MGSVIRPDIPQWNTVLRAGVARMGQVRRDDVRAVIIEERGLPNSECPYHVSVFQSAGLAIDVARSFIYFLSFQQRDGAALAADILAKHFGVTVDDWTGLAAASQGAAR